MNCKSCATASKTIAGKIIRRGPSGITKCTRLECGHAWHVETPLGASNADDDAAATPCGCGEIATVNALLVAGRRLSADTSAHGEESFRAWSAQVLEALDGVPAESGAPSLVRTATTATKSQTSSTAKKIADLNELLVRSITAVT
jgi:hypothetical protein